MPCTGVCVNELAFIVTPGRKSPSCWSRPWIAFINPFRLTVFMVGLLFGRSATWNGQARDAHGISWRTAIVGLWPAFLFGCAVLGGLAYLSPTLLLWSLPLTFGYLVAFPFAVATAAPGLGDALTRLGLCAIPEETDTPPEIRAVQQNG